jgi:hypothetical protein
MFCLLCGCAAGSALCAVCFPGYVCVHDACPSRDPGAVIMVVKVEEQGVGMLSQ